MLTLDTYCCSCALVCLVFACTETSPSTRTSSCVHPALDSANATRAAVPADPSRRGLIVVLGSSTSAGTGPQDPMNAWVPRYRAHLARQFPNVTLVNLAVGGQTTFEVQPTGYVPPANRPAPVAGKNITAALALSPQAIIVNFPSNDQAQHFPLAEQLANYDRIAKLASSAHVLLWVSTTQPRNFGASAELQSLMQARDAIATTFAPRALDFWTPFSAPNGHIRPIYDSGDGTHLNDAAHAILASIVEAARIPQEFPASVDVARDLP